MLIARPPDPPADGDSPEDEPGEPLRSIQQFESPEDAAEAQLMADQRPAEPATGDGGPAGDAGPAGDRGTAKVAGAATAKRVPGERATADRAPERARPASPAPADPAAARAAADIQTTSGVPATPIGGPATPSPAAPPGPATPSPATPSPAAPGPTAAPGPATPGPAGPGPTAASGPGETTQRIILPPVIPGRDGATARSTTRPAVPVVPGRPEKDSPASTDRPTDTDSTGSPAGADSSAMTVELPVVITPDVDDPPTVVNLPALTQVRAPRPASAPQTEPAPQTAPVRVRRPVDLGRAPGVLAVSSFGVLLVALAYADGRDDIGGAVPIYWIGQLVVFTPVVARLLSRRLAGVGESFLLVMGLAIHQYFLKWMYSPDQFRFPDELQHWLATTLITQTGELFRPNLALPPAVHFPGLAEMGAAVSSLTGLSVTGAGLLVAGVAHLLFVGALFAAVLRAGGSPAVAGVACVIYATSLHYLFFNSMYLYATGALPFLMLAVWASRRWRTGGGWPFALVAVVAIGATTVTHHVTAFMLVGTLALLGFSELVTGGRARRWSALIMPLVALAMVAGWITAVARDVIAYLEAPFSQIAETISVMSGGAAEGPTTTAEAVPLWQLAIQGAGLLALLALYLAIARDMIQRRDRDSWRWAALIGSGVFFAGNVVRFLGTSGPEIAGRLSTFTYVPISILAAIALVQATRLLPRRNDSGRWLRGGPAPALPTPSARRQGVRIAAGSVAITLLMIGARVGGYPPAAALLPGSYQVSAFERSVDKQGVEAADWQREVLGPGNRVGGDTTAVFLSATYGRQDPVREVGELFYSPRWTLDNDEQVRSLAIDYLVVDQRLSTELPQSGAYFEHDPLDNQHTAPISAQQLAKFDDVTGADRLYDNGDIHIYRMGTR